jgi:two-component system, sensor histidine kinase and response regulator
MTPAAHNGDILLVDDHAPNLELMSQVLTHGGYRVRVVSSGERALEAARLQAPECVLLDVAMPGMNGFETCRALHDTPKLATVPVIFLTASNELHQRLEGFASGGQDYITKPFQAEEVLARVATHVRLFRAQSELAARNAQLDVARARVEQAAVMRARLSAMLIHDLKSPLTVIRCALDLVQGDDEALADAAVAFEKIENMVQELLELYRGNEEPCGATLQAVRISDVIHRTIAATKHYATERGVGIAPPFVQADCVVTGNPEKLDRVLTNLLENAIKHSERGKFVNISLSQEEGVGVEAGLQFADITVADAGPGIAPRDLPYIFDPYQQRSPSHEPGSVGLGLSIVQRLVAEHGGRVRVRSQLGVGSEFQVLLPL